MKLSNIIPKKNMKIVAKLYLFLKLSSLVSRTQHNWALHALSKWPGHGLSHAKSPSLSLTTCLFLWVVKWLDKSKLIRVIFVHFTCGQSVPLASIALLLPFIFLSDLHTYKLHTPEAQRKCSMFLRIAWSKRGSRKKKNKKKKKGTKSRPCSCNLP